MLETHPSTTAISRAAPARRAVTAVFFGNGLMIATLAVRTPSLKIEHGLTKWRGLLTFIFQI